MQELRMMNYKGYIARIEYDNEDELFVGHLAGIRDIVSFHGVTVDELKNAFHEAVEHYLAVCKKRGEEPQKLYSGDMKLHVSPELHAAVVVTAETQGKTVNQWISEVLSQATLSY